MAFGARVRLLGRAIRRNRLRRLLGRLFAITASVFLRVDIYDTQCGAKLFRVTPDLPVLFREPFANRWIFDVEIIARLMRARTGTERPQARDIVYEVPLSEWRDAAGSKIRIRDFVIAIGRHLAGIWTGVLSAAFLAFCAGHVQQCHFYTVDITLAFWTTLGVYMILKLPSDRTRPYLVCGLVCGMAAGARLMAGMLCLPFLLAHVWQPQAPVEAGEVHRVKRFPIAHTYYRRLAEESLGFERVAQFKVPPEFLGLTYSEAGAEPTITGFDHPLVAVYRRSNANVEELLQRWKAEIRTDPSLPDRYAIEGVRAYRRKAWRQAEDAFRRSLEVKPDFALGRLLLREVYVAEGRHAAAKRELGRIADSGLTVGAYVGMIRVGLVARGATYLNKYIELTKANLNVK